LTSVKLRDSGMPAETYWETLFDVPLILDRLGIDSRLRDLVELGGGYGTFTLPVAIRISGTLTTYDISESMIARIQQRARATGLTNIRSEVRDVFADGFGVAAASQDACLLFNILHGEVPSRLLTEAARVVRPGGAVLVIHWRCDIATPRGPSLDIRPRPDQIVNWASQTQQLEANGAVLDLPPWHYGIRFRRR
jgi:SAM-dependent methyltransferase